MRTLFPFFLFAAGRVNLTKNPCITQLTDFQKINFVHLVVAENVFRALKLLFRCQNQKRESVDRIMGENCDNFITSAVGSGMGGGINSACSLVMNGSLAESTSSAHNTHSLSPIAHISSSPNSSSNQPQQFSADYLSQLLKDKKQLTAFPNIFMHMERLVDEGKRKICSNNSLNVLFFAF